MPKQLLFGELEKRRPCHGTKRRWRDVAEADVKAVGTGDGWCDLAQDRQAWFARRMPRWACVFYRATLLRLALWTYILYSSWLLPLPVWKIFSEEG